MIAFGAVAEAAGLEATVIAFLGDPVFALFLGLLGAYLLAWRTLTKERVEEAMGDGFNATGQILLITGIGGSLGAVIGETGLDKILGELLSAEAGTPALLTILLARFIAAVLHLAIGSISVATITAAGILAPIMGSIEVPASVSRSATTALSFATHRKSPVWSSNAKLAASPLTLTPRWGANCTRSSGYSLNVTVFSPAQWKLGAFHFTCSVIPSFELRMAVLRRSTPLLQGMTQFIHESIHLLRPVRHKSPSPTPRSVSHGVYGRRRSQRGFLAETTPPDHLQRCDSRALQGLALPASW